MLNYTNGKFMNDAQAEEKPTTKKDLKNNTQWSNETMHLSRQLNSQSSVCSMLF